VLCRSEGLGSSASSSIRNAILSEISDLRGCIQATQDTAGKSDLPSYWLSSPALRQSLHALGNSSHKVHDTVTGSPLGEQPLRFYVVPPSRQAVVTECCINAASQVPVMKPSGCDHVRHTTQSICTAPPQPTEAVNIELGFVSAGCSRSAQQSSIPRSDNLTVLSETLHAGQQSGVSGNAEGRRTRVSSTAHLRPLGSRDASHACWNAQLREAISRLAATARDKDQHLRTSTQQMPLAVRSSRGQGCCSADTESVSERSTQMLEQQAAAFQALEDFEKGACVELAALRRSLKF
jgi:hypothetical protein